MDAPHVCLLLLTYGGSPERRSYAMRTLRAALDNLRYSGPLSVHVADDGSPEEHRRDLLDLAGGYSFVRGTGITNSERRGYGANYNLATQAIHTYADVILTLEDDWELAAPLGLDPFMAALEDPRIDCVRMGYLGFTQTLRATVVNAAGMAFLLFDPGSEEPHVCAGHPRLETRAFQQRIGPWAEGLDPGATEFEWCVRPEARTGVVWPLAFGPMGPWGHIGTVQAREDQREAIPEGIVA